MEFEPQDSSQPMYVLKSEEGQTEQKKEENLSMLVLDGRVKGRDS